MASSSNQIRFNGATRLARRPVAVAALLGVPRQVRPDTNGTPLREILGKALSDATGTEYQPPKIRELEELVGADTFAHLMVNPRIKEAVQVWAHSTGKDRAAVIKSLAVLIADEVKEPDLTWRIRTEIGRLK